MESLSHEDQLRHHLQEFLASPARTVWIVTDDLKLYVRKGVHLIDHRLRRTLDLATIEVVRRRQGMFKNTLRLLQDICPLEGVFVENVCPELESYLQRLQLQDSRWSCNRLPPGPSSWGWIKEGTLATPDDLMRPLWNACSS